MTRLRAHGQGRAYKRLSLLVVAFVIAAISIIGMGSASAVEVTTVSQTSTLKAATGAESGAVCKNDIDKKSTVEYLPVYRWSDATGNFHTRYSAVDLTNVPDRVVNTAFTSLGFAAGNSMWQLSTNLVELATRACPLNSAGGLVDNYAGGLANKIMDSGIVAALVVIAILGIAFRGLRSGGANWKNLWPKAAAVGLFAILMTGAAASTGGGASKNPDANYVPGVGSPGYFAITIDRVISSLTALPVSMLIGEESTLDGASKGSGNDKNTTDNFKNSCPKYVNQLNKLYTLSYGTSDTAQMIASTPKALSAMWETSGLRSWRKTQFGDKNWSGNHMYCYALEKEIDVPVVAPKKNEDSKFAGGSISEITKRMGIGAANPNSFIWARASSNDVLDQQLVALAECRLKSGNISGKGTFSARKFADKDKSKTQVTNTLCNNAFKENGKGNVTPFDWPPRTRPGVAKTAIDSATNWFPGGDPPGKAVKDAVVGKSSIDSFAADDGARDFLRSLHGDESGTSIILTIAFVISSFTILLAFGLISIAIIAAKMWALVLIFMIFFVILGMLLPNSDNNKLMSFVKQYAGISFFIFGFQLILSILVLLTKVLIEVGNDAIASDFANMLWGGFSPLIALVVMHKMFKKMSLPSPLSVNAGQSWGKAAAAGAVGAAAGGAIGAGIGSRLGNSAKNKAKDAGMNAAGNTAIGKKLGIKGSKTGDGTDSGNVKNRVKPSEKADARESIDGKLDGSQTDGVDAEGNSISATPGDATATTAEKGKDLGAAIDSRVEKIKEAHAARKEQGGIVARAGHSASQKFAKAASDLKNKPVRTLSKAGLAVGAIGVMGPGVLLAAGLVMGAKKGVASVGTAAGMKTATNRDAMARQAERRGIAKQEEARVEEQQREIKTAQQDAIELLSRENAQQVTVGKAHDEANIMENAMENAKIRQQEESAWAVNRGETTDPSKVLAKFIKATTHQQLKPKAPIT